MQNPGMVCVDLLMIFFLHSVLQIVLSKVVVGFSTNPLIWTKVKAQEA